MSWNESGGSKNPGPRNPWDRRPEGGPPDLDEIVRNLRRRLAGWFGGRPSATGGGGGGGAPFRGIPWGLVAALLVAVWFASGFYLVGTAAKAVVTRFGRFDRITGEGPNVRLPWPIESHQVINTQEVLSFSDRTRMLTADQALVVINIAVQYRRSDPQAYVFNIVDPQETLGEASESAIREIVGQNKLDFVLEQGRQQIAVRTRQLIQRTLDSYKSGLEVIGVNLQDVSVPEQVAPAQKDAIKAREDKDRLRVEAETYANDILPRARGTAERQLLDAEADRQRAIANAEGEGSRFAQLAAAYEKAPAVTRQRLYLETMEAVFGGPGKVYVDTKGNGNMLYLPLDKLLERKAAEAPKPPVTLPDVTVMPMPPSAAEPAPDARSRTRGSR